MTSLTEAYRSTGDEAYRDEALAMLDVLEETYPDSVGAWRGFLQGKNDFPGWNYWY